MAVKCLKEGASFSSSCSGAELVVGVWESAEKGLQGLRGAQSQWEVRRAFWRWHQLVGGLGGEAGRDGKRALGQGSALKGRAQD